jgi:hypothetical protein
MKDNPVDKEKVKSFLLEVLKENVDSKSIEWLLQQKEKIAMEASYLKFYMAFSQASRYFKKQLLSLSEKDKEKANQLVKGFSPASWDQLQAARSYLLLHFEENDPSTWVKALNKLFETADMHEQQSLYAAIPLMPFQKEMTERAIEGLRTNISSVFDAVALNNPFPSKYFDERAWNQMVIKAVFLQRPLYQIQNANIRANHNLAKILTDFAHERWAAGRKVMPELWRFVGPYIDGENITDIKKVFDSGDLLHKKAALLACSLSDFSEAKKLLEQYPDLKAAIQNGNINWESLGKEFQSTIQ